MRLKNRDGRRKEEDEADNSYLTLALLREEERRKASRASSTTDRECEVAKKYLLYTRVLDFLISFLPILC